MARWRILHPRTCGLIDLCYVVHHRLCKLARHLLFSERSLEIDEAVFVTGQMPMSRHLRPILHYFVIGLVIFLLNQVCILYFTLRLHEHMD